MQHEITSPLQLLNDQGLLVEPGWARKPYWNYDRTKIKAPWHRIKEWDYYAVLSHDKLYGITVTVAELGYAALCAVCWLDFKERTFKQLDTLALLTCGRLNMPPSSESGNVRYKDKKLAIDIMLDKGRRHIQIDAPAFVAPDGKRGLTADIILEEDPNMDSMAIATSWEENRKAFYYNRKINCMPARGKVIIGSTPYTFSPQTDFGCLDWGRGNWTYKNRWYWGSASGVVQGNPFGWNIGYGFSDRTPASENMLFYRGRAHKLDQVSFIIDARDYLKPWRFTSNDHRFEMEFTPLVDRNSALNLFLLESIQHQVFGLFNGEAVLDDGKVLHVENFLGFAEDVLNCW